MIGESSSPLKCAFRQEIEVATCVYQWAMALRPRPRRNIRSAKHTPCSFQSVSYYLSRRVFITTEAPPKSCAVSKCLITMGRNQAIFMGQSPFDLNRHLRLSERVFAAVHPSFLFCFFLSPARHIMLATCDSGGPVGVSYLQYFPYLHGALRFKVTAALSDGSGAYDQITSSPSSCLKFLTGSYGGLVNYIFYST